MIDISDLDKATVLAALYNAARPQGLGFMHYDPTPMSVEEAKKLIRQGYFDYLKGRALMIDLSGDQFNPFGYDRDNGLGAAHRAIESLRGSADPNSAAIQEAHAVATDSSLGQVRAAMDQDSRAAEQADTFELYLGLSDMRSQLAPHLEGRRPVHRRW